MTDNQTDTISPPFLMIQHFIVKRGDKFVYDQKFRIGLNIIRGDNTTGKSTIMDLIYFALGAELTEWTTEQELCDETIIEVHLNYKPYCFKREITTSGKSPIYIFEGKMKEALSNVSKWFRYPNARSEAVQSYSQKIFEILTLPSHKTDDSKNLTMHQILRLMYIDQLSEITKLLKEDKKFDNSSIRRAIGEYLLGIDNLDAHNIRQELIEANSRFDKANSELKAIYSFIGSADSYRREGQIDNEIKTLQAEIQKLNEKKEKVKTEEIDKLNDEIKTRVKSIIKKIEGLSTEKNNLSEQKDEIRSEIVDTTLFLGSLDQRLQALEQSKATSSQIGELIFKYCPACLTPIQPNEKHDCCGLCKEDLSGSERHYAYIQMSNEINFQKKESEQLLKLYNQKIQDIDHRLPAISKEIEFLKIEYNNLSTSLNSSEALLSEIGGEIGFKRGIISSLEEKKKMLGQVERLITAKQNAQSRITELEEKLSIIEASTKNRHDFVYSSIEAIAKTILHKDGGYEEAFESVEEVSFNFERDKMFVNGRSKFSASSMVVMKNSIRIALFLHCINDKGARLLRFLLVDNIEDKGMTESRSQNFQRQIVSMCDELENDYQLIFTTSMIEPELDKSEYVVGPHYKKGEHTLALN